ncbi:MAG: ABC transporter substrate-binding protein [Thermodesulfobacteriota bacterium]
MSRTGLSFILLLTLFALGSLAGCGREAKEPPLLRIGHAPTDHHASLFIAAMNPEYFRKHDGIWLKEKIWRSEYELLDQDRVLARVVIDASTGGQELVRRLAEEQQDMVTGGVPAMLNFIDQGSAIRIVAPLMADGAALVGRPALPADNWQGFVALARTAEPPLRIGYKIGLSVQHLILEQALQAAGLSFSHDIADSTVDVILVNLFGEKNLLPALENALVDGVVTNQPFPAMAEVRGVGKIVALLHELPPAGKWRSTPCCALAASERYISEQPEVAGAMVALLREANRFLKNNPDKSAVQIARWLEIDPEMERRSLPTITWVEEFDADWQRGVAFWVEAMIAGDLLHGKVKEAAIGGRVPELIYDRSLGGRGPQGR